MSQRRSSTDLPLMPLGVTKPFAAVLTGCGLRAARFGDGVYVPQARVVILAR